MIRIDDYPQLTLLAWNRKVREIDEDEAYGLYRAYWRFVDPATLTPDEAALIDRLRRQFSAAILFLDLDGVLHGLNGTTFSKREWLWQILRAVPSLEVVITSSWRERIPLAGLAGLTALATASGGEDLLHRFVGVTPILKDARKAHRQAEILAWLDANSHAETPWLALDDDPGLFEKNCPNLIRCPVSGLDQQTVDAVLRRLRPTIFLDFDGVLHPEGLDDVSRLFECALRLWKILRAVPAAQVVFSTSWRTEHSLDELVDFATTGGGEDLADRFIGVTPTIKVFDELGDYRQRERQCLAWREQAGHIGDWLAIDDIDRWFSTPSRNVFIADFQTGLSDADVPAIIKRITEESEMKESGESAADQMRNAAKRQREAKAAGETDLCSNGAPHQWGYDGQTMLNTRWTCDVCHKTKLE